MYWITGLLGLALMASPFVFGYTGSPAALWTDLVLGGLVAIASLWKLIAQDNFTWEYWAAGILGILAIIAPFVFGFSTLVAALWATLVLGACVAVLAGYKVLFPGQHADHPRAS